MSIVIESSKATRPFVVRYGALGDMVMLTALIRHLYIRFGQPVDVLASGSWTRPLLEGQPGVGNLFIVGSRNTPYWLSADQQRLVRQLRARRPSATWLGDVDNLKTQQLLSRAGWSAQHSHEWTGIPGPHLCDMFLRFAYRDPKVLGGLEQPMTATDAYGLLHVTEQLRTELDTWLQTRQLAHQPLILIQPGNKRTMRRGMRRRVSNTKYWPEKNWATVLRGLRERHADHAILMLGVPQEASLNDEIIQVANVSNVHNVAHELPIPRLMALAQRARGTISVDTGPAHLVAAVGGAVVTLFGKSNPLMYAPRGPNARVACLTGAHAGEQSMLGITPEEVLAAWNAQHRRDL
ncbi:MAG: glycosyltransferase family 9 protein [Candidatus Obscuribacterales bacterium]|nr:glycosyltransferase family 9 protein [Steroidobacteraceae bacterium]